MLFFDTSLVGSNQDSHYLQQIGGIVNVLVIVYISFDLGVEG